MRQGQHHTAATKARIRKASKALWADPVYRQRWLWTRRAEAWKVGRSDWSKALWANPDYRKKQDVVRRARRQTAITKAKVGVIAKARWTDHDYKERLRAAHRARHVRRPELREQTRAMAVVTNKDPKVLARRTASIKRRYHADPAYRARLATQCRGNPSKIEIRFLDWFEKRIGCPVERGVSIGGYVVDGKVGKMIVEVDGKYWHTMPGRKKCDKARDQKLKSLGYAVFHVSDEQAYKVAG